MTQVDARNDGTLGPDALQAFGALRMDAIQAVTARFFEEHASIYAQFGQRGRAACSEDLGFHLEFLRPVLELGLIDPMVDYLRWLATVLAKRGIPTQHLPQSLDWLAEFFASRMTAPDGDAVVAALRAVRERFLEKDDSLPAIYAKLPAASPDCAEFEAALLGGDRRAAAGLVDHRLSAGDGLIDVELHTIQPALYGIGQKWQTNQVSIAREHLATAVAYSVMAQGRARCEPAVAPNGKRVLLACVESNQHALGLQMVADAFELGGWNVAFLGANVPTASLIGHIEEWQPHLLGLSVSFAHQLRVVKDVVSRLQRLPGRRPALMIGGLAINNFDALAARLGADAWSADAAAAVASADRLVSRAA